MSDTSTGSITWAKKLVEDEIIPMVQEGRNIDLIKLVARLKRLIDGEPENPEMPLVRDSPDLLTLCFRKGSSGAFFVYAVEIGGYEVVAPTFEDALRLVPKYLADLAEAGSEQAKAVWEAVSK